MAAPRTVVYAGETFYLQTTGRYYQSGTKDAPERLLHRRMWCDAHGPLPAGAQVHHRDHDWTNNALDNLEVRLTGEHQRAHMRQRLANPVHYAEALAYLAKGRQAAAAWHRSPSGRAWHRQHAKESWQRRRGAGSVVCVACSRVFVASFPTRARYCSLSCRHRQSYQRHKTAQRLCERCGQPFTCNKYRATRYCGYACSNRSRIK